MNFIKKTSYSSIGLVSVIIPTYNRVKLLAESVDSIRLQSYRPIELLIVDDGSTDNTSQFVAEWSRAHNLGQDFSVRYLKQENCGAAAARNYGIAESKGEFIQFLDSDDLLHPEKIARQVKCSLEHNLTVYGECRRFAADSKGILLYPALARNYSETALRDWFEGRFIAPASFLWRRTDVLQNGPWDRKESFDDDGEFACRFLLNGGKWRFCPDSWSYYRIYLDSRVQQSIISSPDALISKLNNYKLVEKKLKELGWFDSLRVSFSSRYWNLAKQAAFFPEVKDEAISCYKRLNPHGSIPETLGNKILYRIFGIAGRKRFALFFRRYLKIQPFKCMGRVNSINKLFV